MSDVILELPLSEDIYLALQSAGLTRDKLRAHALQDLAIQLYTEGRLSLGKAAQLAGLRLWGFWLLLVERNLPVFEYTPEDYQADLAIIRQLARQGSA